jgi:hypothetical protein
MRVEDITSASYQPSEETKEIVGGIQNDDASDNEDVTGDTECENYDWSVMFSKCEDDLF